MRARIVTDLRLRISIETLSRNLAANVCGALKAQSRDDWAYRIQRAIRDSIQGGTEWDAK